MRLPLLVAIILASAVSGCGSYLPLLSTPTTMSASVSGARAAATIISKYRAANGLGPVSLDERLNQAAEHQARAVAATGILSHGEFTSRMAQYGIRGYRAENLAAGSDSVEDVIARWKASPSHNQNILFAPGVPGRAGPRRNTRLWLGPLLGSRALRRTVRRRCRNPLPAIGRLNNVCFGFVLPKSPSYLRAVLPDAASRRRSRMNATPAASWACKNAP